MANALGIELGGQDVVLREETLKAEYRDLTWRVFHVDGGFGASPHTMGNALVGQFVRDGEKCRMEGYHVERLATPDEVEAARKAGE